MELGSTGATSLDGTTGYSYDSKDLMWLLVFDLPYSFLSQSARVITLIGSSPFC